MKTLTEFASMNLKLAAQTHQQLVSSGKTPEELPTALGEALKLEGDRLKFLITALELVGTKTHDLKRVVVFTLNEGEKAPAHAVQKESQYFLVEYYPSLEKKPQGQGPFQKSDDRNKRKGKRGRRGPSRGGESSQQRLEGSSEGQPSSDSPKRARRPFRPRNQSQTQPQQPGTGPKIIIKPVTPITQVTAPSAEPAPAVLAEPTPSAT